MRTEVVARRPGRERAQRETEPFSCGSRTQSATVDRPASVWPESCLGGRAIADRIRDLLARETAYGRFLQRMRLRIESFHPAAP